MTVEKINAILTEGREEKKAFRRENWRSIFRSDETRTRLLIKRDEIPFHISATWIKGRFNIDVIYDRCISKCLKCFWPYPDKAYDWENWQTRSRRLLSVLWLCCIYVLYTPINFENNKEWFSDLLNCLGKYSKLVENSINFTKLFNAVDRSHIKEWQFHYWLCHALKRIILGWPTSESL